MTMRMEPFGNFSSAGSSDVTLCGAGSCINCSYAGCSCAGSSNVDFASKKGKSCVKERERDPLSH
jgi:hypothetical protein